MKKILMILTMAILLPAAAFANKKKQPPQPESMPQPASASQQDGTDWLNAPTPDGSPTLKETSDWLAKTLTLYGGSHDGTNGSESTWGKITRNVSATVIAGAGIDAQCHFAYSEISAEGTRVLAGNGTWNSKHEDVSYTGTTVSIPLGFPGLWIADDAQLTDGQKSIDLQTGTTQAIQLSSVALDRKNYWIDENDSIQILRQAPWPAGKTSYTHIAQPDVAGRPPQSNEAGSELRVSASEIRPRIVNALQHAVQLCKSVYTPPAKTKDPF